MINTQFAWKRGAPATINAIEDYSDIGLGATDFILSPPVGEIWNVTRMIFSLSDLGVLDSGYWGATNAALTNGIKLEVYQQGKAAGTKLIDLFENFPIKQNGQWGAVCYDVQTVSFGGGDSWLVVRYTFTRDTNSSKGILLDGTNGDEIVIPLNDDFTGLVSQHFRFGINKI